jgi:protein tyrosine/serine phosphatase
MKTKTLPQTDSLTELAQFWDTHDVTDFEDELEEVTEPIFERKDAAVVRVYFQPQEVELLQLLAKAQGLDLGALIHQWVLERLVSVGSSITNGHYAAAD